MPLEDGSVWLMGGGGGRFPATHDGCLANFAQSGDAECVAAAPMARERTAHAATASACGRFLYVFGGLGSEAGARQYGPLLGAERLDVATRTWAPLAAAPTPRIAAGALVFASDEVALVGGCRCTHHGDGGSTQLAASCHVDVYAPATDSWRRAAWRIPRPCGDVDVQWVGAGETHLAVSGRDDATRAPVSWLLDVAANTWRPLAEAPP